MWESLEASQVREGVTRVIDDWVERQARERGITQFLKEPSEQLDLLEVQRVKQYRLERRLLEEEAEILRSEILLKRNPLIVMLDLGFGILDDATVETAAIVLRGGVL